MPQLYFILSQLNKANNLNKKLPKIFHARIYLGMPRVPGARHKRLLDNHIQQDISNQLT